jgi:hypothetical protein
MEKKKGTGRDGKGEGGKKGRAPGVGVVEEKRLWGKGGLYVRLRTDEYSANERVVQHPPDGHVRDGRPAVAVADVP